ncbi:DUF4118 domain-containing protein [Candidatus Vagococcus giribetii]|uniref:DUF4118 domain-containing protein n=1 Tax=Candidatus Vagococcus giribetii TaxID=2230876 RepID=UPI00351C87AC
MITLDSERLSPETWLKQVKPVAKYPGKLKVFFGYAAGVGKTYAMLEEAHDQLEIGRQVLVGYVEPHTRPETTKLLEGLTVLPPKVYEHKGIKLKDFDLDGALLLHPDLVLVDELAHSNPPSARNKKRYQDIEELLKAGIDVYTTVNVQHIESLNDVVEEMTGIVVQETVPDVFFEESSLKVIDIEAGELLERLRLGKIYQEENTSRALQNFFVPEKLNLLRGLAIQKAADHIIINENKEVSKIPGMESVFLSLIFDDEVALTKRTLRWTARLSQLLRAKWFALRLMTEETEGENQELIKLAEKLGAEVVNIESYDVIETITSFVKLQGVTDLVIGKNVTLPWWKKIFREPIEDKLFGELKQTEIHLLPYDEKAMKPKSGLSSKIRNFFEGNKFKDFSITFFLMLFTTFMSSAFFGSGFGDQNIIILYLVTVILVARFTTGYFWSGLSSVLSVIFFNWFFVEPLYSLTVYKEGYPITLIIMLAVGLLVSNIMVRMKASSLSSNKKEHQIQILYDLNRRYLLTSQLYEVLQITATYLSNSLNRDVFIYDESFEKVAKSFSESQGNASVLNKSEEQAIAQWVALNQKEAGVGTDTLVGAKARYFPVILQGDTAAVIGVASKSPLEPNELTEENLNFIRLVTVQMAIAIEQKMLQKEKQRILVDQEKEKTKGNLLRAISHDLRTPLTSISGAVEMVLNEEPAHELSREEKKQFLIGIEKDAEWLLRMVENLLSITRIDTQKMEVKKTEEVLDDILSSAIFRIKKYYPGIQLEVSLPDEVVLVQVDPILMEQVIFNLLENSVRYGVKDKPIKLKVVLRGNATSIHVINEGQIEDITYLNSLLDNDHKETVIDSKKGLGIGLSIVKTIISAHNGIIYATETDDKEIDVTIELRRKKG